MHVFALSDIYFLQILAIFTRKNLFVTGKVTIVKELVAPIFLFCLLFSIAKLKPIENLLYPVLFPSAYRRKSAYFSPIKTNLLK